MLFGIIIYSSLQINKQKIFDNGIQKGKMPYGTAEDETIWRIWLSKQNGIKSIENVNIMDESINRITNLAYLSQKRKKDLKKKFGRNQINSKKDFVELLTFELFDYKKHGQESANLQKMFDF